MRVIEVEKLSKTYSSYRRRDGVWGSVKDLFNRQYEDIVAVDQISFSVEAGELLGYIGPNGAGKSTSIKMLTGILQPSGGEMSILGFHPFRQRKQYTKHIGVVFGQRTQLWWDIAVKESFKLLRTIYEVDTCEYRKRLDLLSDVLELGPLLDLPVRKLSLGQRIRCDLAASLLHNPSVLFLDEPTIGLDTVAKDSVRKFLRTINRELNTTVLLTTHDLHEIEELCHRIVILDKGHIIYDGDLDHVRNLPGMTRKAVIDFHCEVDASVLGDKFQDKVTFENQGQRRVTAEFDPQRITTVELLKGFVGDFPVSDLSIAEADIEQVVMKIYREGMGPK